MMIVLSLVLIVSMLVNIMDCNPDDTYNLFLNRITDIGIKQNNTIVYDIYDYPIIDNTDDNGIYSMINISIDNHHDIYAVSKSNNNILFSLLLLPTSSITHNVSDTKILNTSSIMININITMTNFRIISIGTKIYVVAIDSKKNILTYTRLYYSNSKQFSVNDDSIIYIDTHNSPDECKNLNTWVPVPNSNVNTTGHPGFGFICSIYPHRIVLFDQSSSSSNNTMYLQINTIRMLETMTVISHDIYAEFFIQLFWPYGYPLIPSTTPLLINTTVGEKYLVFFESSGKVMNDYANTYFFGVYLFDTISPYGITHFSLDPIIPLKIYNKDNQWVDNRINYMVIPTGCIAYNNTIVLSLVSKKTSYIMKMNKDKLVSSLRSVTSQSLEEMYVHQRHTGKLTPYYHHVNLQIHNEFRVTQYKSIIKNEFKLLGNMRNPTMALLHNEVVLITCLPYNSIRWGVFFCQYKFHNASLFYQGLHEPSTDNDTKLIGFEYNSTDINEALYADDLRILSNNNITYGIFNRVRKREKKDPYHFDIFIAQLGIHNKLLYVKGSVILMSVEHIVGLRSQKNWTPFFCGEYDPLDIYSNLCFVYSLVPHKIVKFEKRTSAITSQANMTLIAETGDQSILSLWRYGEPRGGTQAELIETPFGKRYLTFFHSSHMRGRRVKTYYSGAYLFNSKHPYEITHISSEPLSPKSFYNVSKAWTHANMDFVVFPMSYILENDILHVTFGVQDNSGYLLSLNCTSFLLSLKPVLKE